MSGQPDAKVDSLVFYKGQPAVVKQVIDKKVTIELANGERISVRPKDFDLLHSSPSTHTARLAVPDVDPKTAWGLID